MNLKRIETMIPISELFTPVGISPIVKDSIKLATNMRLSTELPIRQIRKVLTAVPIAINLLGLEEVEIETLQWAGWIKFDTYLE